jgi:glycosyltransferase involved in cell wall biosynthesis
LEPIPDVQATSNLTPAFLYVGRLARSKRVADIVRAFAAFCRTIGPAFLTLIGDGPPVYVAELQSLASSLGVSERIRFLGRVSSERKHQEMASAHLLLITSVREGWGLVVTEANAHGVPAIAYDVPGLRDSVLDKQTGVLVEPRPEALTAIMRELWVNHDMYTRLSTNARAWSQKFSFDKTADAFRAALNSAVGVAAS